MLVSPVDRHSEEISGRDLKGDRAAAGAATRSPRSLAGAAAAFAASMAKFAASGFKTVDAGLHGLRLGHCRACEHRRDSQCALCRCFIDKKAWLPHEDCPIGRWPT